MIPNDILLLKIISFDGNLSLLNERGLSYSQIANLLRKLKDTGYLEYEESSICLTDKGKLALQEYNKTHSSRKQFLVRQEHLFFKPMSETEVFLPKKKDII